MNKIIPQSYPLYGYDYPDPEDAPNKPGPLSVVVGWIEWEFGGGLAPLLVPLGEPGAMSDMALNAVLFTDMAEAEGERQESLGRHLADGFDRWIRPCGGVRIART
jgi:hypothetical protein